MLRVYCADPTAHCREAPGAVKIVVLYLSMPAMHQFALIRRDTQLRYQLYLYLWASQGASEMLAALRSIWWIHGDGDRPTGG